MATDPEAVPAKVPETTSCEIPRSDAGIAAAAAARGIAIPAPCREGVAANLALLARHAAILRGETR